MIEARSNAVKRQIGSGQTGDGKSINILGISKLKWSGMGEFNSDDRYIYYCGQESLRRNGEALIVNKRVQNAVLGCNLKNDRMISVRFQGKPFNITIIQVYAPTANAEEAETEWFYEDLQDLLELTSEKDVLFVIGVPRGFPTGLSHVPPLCESILGLKVEAVQGNQVSLEWTETSGGLWEWWQDPGVLLAFPVEIASS